jgi:hypothetical protein
VNQTLTCLSTATEVAAPRGEVSGRPAGD